MIILIFTSRQLKPTRLNEIEREKYLKREKNIWLLSVSFGVNFDHEQKFQQKHCKCFYQNQ